MLTDEQRTQLATTGFTRLTDVVERATIDGVADAVWTSLARRGIDRARRETWPAGFLPKLQGLRQRRLFDVFDTDTMTAVVDELLGAGTWDRIQPWGPALVTFPEPGPWLLPHRGWHMDLPARGDPDRPGVARLFGYVTDVVPRGGATLVVEGSHEVVRRMVSASPRRDAGSSADVRRRLVARHPWFRALCTLGGDGGGDDGGDRIRRHVVDGDEIDGVRVRVAELTANAGDVVVMHPWTLHSASMNSATAPRFMVTHAVYRRG